MATRRRTPAADDPQTLPLFPPGSIGAGKPPSTDSNGHGRSAVGHLEAPRPLPDWSGIPTIPPEVKFGTSSWTYPGWVGQIYQRPYKTLDSLGMLQEYVRCPLFGCVGVDSSFYRPPSRETLQRYRDLLPPGFEALGKVFDRVTIKRFGNDPRLGPLADTDNPHFLDPVLCTEEVIGPWLELLGDRAGPLLFEFQTLYPPHRPSPEAFADRLARFFEALPREGRYAVELRNQELLHPAYFAALRAHGVAHLFNAWTRMPTIGEQLQHPGSLTADFVVSRALLVKGRTYDASVDRFKPYDRLQEPQLEVRRDLLELIRQARELSQKVYILVNNRLEGNSPGTILALRQALADALATEPRSSTAT